MLLCELFSIAIGYVRLMIALATRLCACSPRYLAVVKDPHLTARVAKWSDLGRIHSSYLDLNRVPTHFFQASYLKAIKSSFTPILCTEIRAISQYPIHSGPTVGSRRKIANRRRTEKSYIPIDLYTIRGHTYRSPSVLRIVLGRTSRCLSWELWFVIFYASLTFIFRRVRCREWNSTIGKEVYVIILWWIVLRYLWLLNPVFETG